VSDDAMGLTQRKLPMEMREDLNGLKATVDVIAKDQALGAEGDVTERGDIAGKERKTGRGERTSADTFQLSVSIVSGGPKPQRLVRSA
jgi:hypothetical protein